MTCEGMNSLPHRLQAILRQGEQMPDACGDFFTPHFRHAMYSPIRFRQLLDKRVGISHGSRRCCQLILGDLFP